MGTDTRMGLTREMHRCFRVIEAYIAEHDNAPSYEDLRKALGLSSKSGVVRLVESLAARGWIAYQQRIPRSIVIVTGATTTAPVYALPPNVEAALRAFCLERGEDPSAIVADAVALFLDAAPDKQVAA
jgi:hypothetical protein